GSPPRSGWAFSSTKHRPNSEVYTVFLIRTPREQDRDVVAAVGADGGFDQGAGGAIEIRRVPECRGDQIVRQCAVEAVSAQHQRLAAGEHQVLHLDVDV